jgi:crossover junction endodeoxyribonuclease RuvC
MIILGIDPGIADTGYGVIKNTNNKFTFIDCGTIKTSAEKELPERLKDLYQDLTTIIKKYKPKQIGVEELFFAKNVKTAITVSHARGVILLAAKDANCEIKEFTPLQIKQALTGYGRADKNQIQQMVKTVLQLDKIPKPDDAADALATAICCAQTKYVK